MTRTATRLRCLEDRMAGLRCDDTIVTGTPSTQQAARVSDMAAFRSTELAGGCSRTGRLVEFDRSQQTGAPTEGPITGPFG